MLGSDTEQYLKINNRTKTIKNRFAVALPVLSLLVILVVFWWLKLTGITLAGDAFCGKAEHVHGEECVIKTLQCEEEHEHTDECYKKESNCAIEEHIHIASCYSDITADIETADNWEETLAGISPELSTNEKIVAVAKSQLGYAESTLNFEVDSNDVKHGYTRYGEWYGNPYGDWSVMFTSFCLRYAGVEDVPINSGAEVMRSEWEEKGLYKDSNSHIPSQGNVVFLDKNGNGTADATAIVTEISGGHIYTIEGDLEDKVAESEYPMDSPLICGYGMVSSKSNLMLMNTSGLNVIAKTTAYNQALFTDSNSFVVYTASAGNYYAFDGNGNAVQIYIDSNGNITSDVSDPNLLLWSFTKTNTSNAYNIRNLSTGKYMHAYPNNGSGVITTGAYSSTLVDQGNGTVKIRSNNEYARLVVSSGNFQMTQNQSLASAYNFGVVSRCTVWLDGTNGGLMSLAGSLNKSYTLQGGDTIKLPEEWQSPSKYHYKLQGWYDVKNHKYYKPGTEITVTENMIFYADWVANTYDIGQYNSHVAGTISTKDFITTHVFDYNSLFNLLSENASVSANASGHSETWNLISNGTVAYNGKNSINYIFSDYDATGDISYPSGRNAANTSANVYAGLYNENLGNILFSTENSFNPETGEGIIGKNYIGTADHLFQINNDPTSANYGYHYYDSSLNAASYNKTDGRFYVYDYLERTADSEKDGGGGEYSDFLPFNSPYANTNDKKVITYNYNGVNGEYAGVNHCQYDAKYNTNNNSVDNVGTNYWFGMSMDVRFYLPDAPGSRDQNGNYGNQDIYGKDMHFKFSGDDDVWVFVDGKLVLDIGGIHGIESGDINFATGVVTVNGQQVSTLSDIGEGEHTLTVYYLERGSSQSNCAIYFNLAPRFSLSIQKEDVLTRDLLNGAEFSVYTDKECSVPAELWTSEAEHNKNEPATNVFTIKDGSLTIWGLSAGKTYYIRETKPPDAADYSCAYGVICLSLDKRGVASYSVEIIDETDEDGNVLNTSNGFTVHGFRIDEITQQAYIVVTNAQDWVKETTSVQVNKKWNDNEDHTYDSVTAYLTVTDPDGTVRRIREITLSEENNWQYTWTNLPKYARDGVTEIVYGTEEAYKSGYSPSIEKIDKIIDSTTSWVEAYSFTNGEVYILGTSSGYVSTTSSSANTLCYVNEETARTSPNALWTATVSGNYVRFTNENGQILSFNYSSWSSSNRYFFATTSSTSYQNMVVVQTSTGVRLYCTASNRNYYMGSIGSNGRASASTSSSSGIIFTPKRRFVEITETEAKDFTFNITNTPLEEETSLKVTKVWDLGMANNASYEQSQVTVKLLANGKDTGRTVTLNLKNGWTDTFLGLPYKDNADEVIKYTVEESWETEDWLPKYGEIVEVKETGQLPTYETTVTNTYRWGHGYELPSTGGVGRKIWVLSGLIIMIGSLVLGCILRRKRERRSRE